MHVAGHLEQDAVAGCQHGVLADCLEDLIRHLDNEVGVRLVARVALRCTARGQHDILIEIVRRLDQFCLHAVIIGNTVSQLDARQPDLTDAEDVHDAVVEDGHGDDGIGNFHIDAEFNREIARGHRNDPVIPGGELLPCLQLVGVGPVLENKIREIIADQDHRVDIPVLKVHALVIQNVLADQLVDQLIRVSRLTEERGQPRTDSERAEHQVLGSDQIVLVEQGDLDRAARQVDDGRALLNRALELLAAGRQSLVAEESLLGVREDLDADPRLVANVLLHKLQVAGLAESRFRAGSVS